MFDTLAVSHTTAPGPITDLTATVAHVAASRPGVANGGGAGRHAADPGKETAFQSILAAQAITSVAPPVAAAASAQGGVAPGSATKPAPAANCPNTSGNLPGIGMILPLVPVAAAAPPVAGTGAPSRPGAARGRTAAAPAPAPAATIAPASWLSSPVLMVAIMPALPFTPASKPALRTAARQRDTAPASLGPSSRNGPPVPTTAAAVAAAAPAVALAGARSARPGTDPASDGGAAAASPVPAAIGGVLPAGSANGVVADIPTLAAAVVTAPQDFTSLVDRLVDARTAARSGDTPQLVAAAVTHREFGKVSLDFIADPAGLSVAMTSADPGFARPAHAAVASIAQSGAADPHGGNPGDQGHPAQEAASQLKPGGSAQTDGNGTRSQSHPHPHPQSHGQPQVQSRQSSGAVNGAAVAAIAADQISGIFA